MNDGASQAEWRWIFQETPYENPALNMAVDSALLDGMITGGSLPVIRVYRWKHSAVTLGRMQDFHEVQRIYSKYACIRRETGGRAVVHDNDLTISVVAWQSSLKNQLNNRGILAGFRTIVSGVVNALEANGIKAVYGEESAPGRHANADCFASRAKCDLIDQTSGVKILGAAQLRRKNAILQQMSLRPLIGVDIRCIDFINTLRDSFGSVLGVSRWIECGVADQEMRAATTKLADWEYAPPLERGVPVNLT